MPTNANTPDRATNRCSMSCIDDYRDSFAAPAAFNSRIELVCFAALALLALVAALA